MNRRFCGAVLGVLLLLAAGCGTYQPAQSGTSAAKGGRRPALDNPKRIAIAMHNYHAAHGQFPPAVLTGPDGKTAYSWRVALLPFLEQDELYKQYRFDEPWDGPNNRRLLARTPAAYRAPEQPAGATNASYFVLAGPGTVFDGAKGVPMADIRDGASNTLLIVEAKRDIPWTKPEDIPYDPQKPLPDLGGYDVAGFAVALADGSARVLPRNIEEKLLRALASRAGGEAISYIPSPPR